MPLKRRRAAIFVSENEFCGFLWSLELALMVDFASTIFSMQ